MKHDEPETMCSWNGWSTSAAKHGRKATLPVGKTRNAIFRNIQAKTRIRRPSNEPQPA